MLKIERNRFNGILAKATEFGVEKGLAPILDGFSSYDPQTRKQARKGLAVLQEKVARQLSQTAVDPCKRIRAMEEAALFGALIFHKVGSSSGMAEADIGLFFNTLMAAGGPAQAYAWRLWCPRFNTSLYLKHQVDFFSDRLKLELTQVYLLSGLRRRRQQAGYFKKLLSSIKSRSDLIKHLAKIFRHNDDFDPFWQHLPASLLDREMLLSGEMADPDETLRADALAAMALTASPLPESLLSGVLAHESSSLVRRTAAQVVEFSPRQAYAGLTKPLLQMLSAPKDKFSAMAAFRALVVSAVPSPRKLLGFVTKNCPDLIPLIKNEFFKCDRIAFLCAQDMALAPDRYTGCPDMRNLLFSPLFAGVTCRWPVEVLSMLNTSSSELSSLISKQVHPLYAQGRQMVKTARGKTGGIQWKSPPQPEKIRLMGNENFEKIKQDDGFIPLRAFMFKQTCFQGLLNPARKYHFDKSRFKSCKMDNITLKNSTFKDAVFYRTDLSSARFANVDFEGALFVESSAKNTVFTRCSFKGAQFHGCNFSSTRMTECLISDAMVSESDLTHAALLRSSLIRTRMVKTNCAFGILDASQLVGLNTVECTGIAQGSRSGSPLVPQPVLKAEVFLELDDIPWKTTTELVKIIFAFFSDYGRQKFMAKNRLALLSAADVFTPKTFDLFEIIPLLLHENISFPGYNVYHQSAPCGIRHYLPGAGVRPVLEKYLGKRTPRTKPGGRFYIEAVFTIGSTGTVAQNRHSDLDYWVCIDETKFTPSLRKALEKKLEKLEIWAKGCFKKEIYFFILTMSQVRQNIFGDASAEGSGSAQAVILKDEFYRTMIHVAGKVPLWAVLPEAVCRGYYDDVLALLNQTLKIYPYTDLGNITRIPEAEFYGALIWQIFKGLKNAFKSVIKLSLVEMYYMSSSSIPLLCNRFKQTWINSAALSVSEDNDPYCALIRHLVDFYNQKKDSRSADLIKFCFILQLSDLNPSEKTLSTFGIKEAMIPKLIRAQQWKNDDILRLGDLKKWHFRNISKISDIVKRHFLDRYKTLRQTLESDHPAGSLISPKDRTILARKMYVQFSSQPGKLENLFLVVRNQQYFQELILIHDRTGETWTMIHRSGKAGMKKEEPLITAPTIEEIAAWMINNRLWSGNTQIQMEPNATYVTSEDVNQLFSTMHMLLSPYDRNRVRLEAYLSEPKTLVLFTSVNLYVSRTTRRIVNAVIVSVNSWGEMYSQAFSLQAGGVSVEDLDNILPDLLGISRLPSLRTVFFPRRFAHMALDSPFTRILPGQN